jgi:hypothetical protein
MSTVPLQYKASKAKIAFNYFIAGFLILFGGLFSLGIMDDPSYPVGWIGASIFLAGVGFVIYTHRHNVGRQVKLYPDRVEFIARDKTETWTFDAIEEIRILVGRNAQARPSAQILRYEFLIDGRTAFTVKPIYADWTVLGEKIISEVSQRLTQKYLDQINRGQDVTFDGLRSALRRKMCITVSTRGLVVGNKDLVPWSDFESCQRDEINGTMQLDYIARQMPVQFSFYHSVNGMVLIEIISALMAKNK